MSEQFRGEQDPNPERAEDQKYKALQAAMDEEEGKNPTRPSGRGLKK